MPRNRSEKLTLQQQEVLKILDALRTLVRLNLEAGQPKNFSDYKPWGASDAIIAAAAAYTDAKRGWNPVGYLYWGRDTGWPGVLVALEAYVDKGFSHGTQQK